MARGSAAHAQHTHDGPQPGALGGPGGPGAAPARPPTSARDETAQLQHRRRRAAIQLFRHGRGCSERRWRRLWADRPTEATPVSAAAAAAAAAAAEGGLSPASAAAAREAPGVGDMNTKRPMTWVLDSVLSLCITSFRGVSAGLTSLSLAGGGREFRHISSGAGSLGVSSFVKPFVIAARGCRGQCFVSSARRAMY